MPRPREFDADDVVDSAIDVFRTGGYHGTSTADLCVGTGLARSSLYNCFTNKRGLYGRALERYTATASADVEDALADPRPVRDVLRDFLLAAVDRQFADPHRRGCLAVAAAVEVGPSDGRTAAAALTDFDRVAATIEALLERGRRDGEIAADRDLHAMARMIHATLAGIHVLGRVASDRQRVSDVVDALIATI